MKIPSTFLSAWVCPALAAVATLVVFTHAMPVIARIDDQGVGDDHTLESLHRLDQFQGIDPSHFRLQMWVDPYLGDDSNPGTYEAPLRSIRMIKQECLNRPYMRCTVRGANRVFSPRTLTVDLLTQSQFVLGEEVVTSAPDARGKVIGASARHLVLSISTPPTNQWGASPTAPEPRVGTTVTGSESGAIATVIAFEDTIVGLHSTLFGPDDLSIQSPTLVSVDGHGYSDGDGPLLWLNQTTMPSTTGVQVIEAITPLWVCDATRDTFELSVSPSCAGGRVGVSSSGAGLNQLVAYYGIRSDNDRVISAAVPLSMKCDPADRHRICSLFESEHPESPWIIDGGGFYLNEIRALVRPEQWPGAESGGRYNTPIGYLLGVSNPQPDLSQGWLGIQNGVVQNLSLDALATSDGGKLVALNVVTRAIRNGSSDRSQTGLTNPAYQAHNSCMQATGSPAVVGHTGAVAYWINTGDSWNYQGSHTGSGGCLNPNQNAVLRIISRGRIGSDVHPDDDTCAGQPCQSSLVVNPSADMTVVGPTVLWMGPLGDRNRFHGSGVGTATRYYKVRFERLGAYPSFDTVMPPFFSLVPLAAPDTSLLELNEVEFRSEGKGSLLNVCEAQDGSVRSIFGRNVVYEQSLAPTYDLVVADCSGSSCGGDCGDVTDAVENTYLSLEGVIDKGQQSAAGSYFVQPKTVSAGACGESDTFEDEICRILESDGRMSQQWSWFERDGGPPSETYMVSLRSETFTEYVSDDSCLPSDVLGEKVCQLHLTEGVPVPEPTTTLQALVALGTTFAVGRGSRLAG